MEYISVLAIILIIILFFYLYYDRDAIINRELKKIKSKSILTFKSGELGKVSGTIEHYEQSLKAPLSGTNCVYYEVLVEKRARLGKNRYWKKIIDEKKSVDFIINQNGNKVLVKARNYKAVFTSRKIYNSGFLNDATRNMELYLAKHGKSSTNFLGLNKTITYVERIYQIGEKVSVKGVGYWRHENKHSNNQLVIKEYDGKVVISNSAKTFS